MDFIKRQHAAGKPIFLWVNFSHMHFRTHAKPESIGQSGPGLHSVIEAAVLGFWRRR